MIMNIGDKIPAILGKDQDGNEIKAEDFRGKKLVLYAYPKDNTGGCTAEACSLRDHKSELSAKGYEIIGISKDSATSHKKFIEKQDLNFNLIADTDTTLLQELGAWGEKKFMGKTCVGTLRTTFLVNEEGVITHIFTPKEIKTKLHAEQILEVIGKM
ncbi:MAG: thioredoxin-dependent thiol peroxidase [Bacteroidales bacterium]|nr:thioredoxin-dependent thiol peroxidase [Bacteroidales bacterium]